MASLNKVILIGHLGKDPEIRFTQEGLKVASFSVATSESWKDKETGEKKDKTEWHRIVVMNERLSDIAEKYMKKGSKVYVEGQLQTRKWTDTSGQEHYTTEILLSRFKGSIILLSTKESVDEKSEKETETFTETTSLKSPYNPFEKESSPEQDYTIDDDIPF